MGTFPRLLPLFTSHL